MASAAERITRSLRERLLTGELKPGEPLSQSSLATQYGVRRIPVRVYSGADRSRMLALTDQLRRLTDRYLYLHIGMFGDTEHLRAEHRAILAAVREGDGVAAAELTRVHIVNAHEFILAYLLGHEAAPDGFRFRT